MLKTFSIACAAALLVWAAGACSATDRDVPARSPGKPGAPVRIEVNASAALKPGQPGEVVVTLVPLAPMDSAQVTFRSDAGLTLLSGQSQTFAAPTVGAPLLHRLAVVATNEGRYHVSAVVTTQAAGVSSGRVVSIPIVVGDAAKVQKVQTKDAPAIDATGEHIKSLPAVERSR